MRKPATIPEIARIAGVTTATVSRALRNSPLVKPATREQIHQIASKLNYRVNTAGRQLVTRRTQTIGLITPSLRYPLNAEIAELFMQELNDKKYGLLIASLEDRDATAVSRMQMLSEHCVDGIILQPAMSSWDVSCIDVIKQYQIPFVVSADVPGRNVTFATYDGYDGLLQLTNHLLSQGYRRPGLITSWPSLSITPRQVKGFKEALAKHNLSADSSQIAHLERFDEDWIHQVVDGMLRQEHPVDSLIVTDAVVAMHAYLYLLHRPVRIGADFGFASVDDSMWFREKGLSVTSLKYPNATIVQSQVSMLLERIAQPHLPHQSLYYKPELEIRASSRRSLS